MEIAFHCDNCGCQLVADDEGDERVVECSKCRQVVLIPQRQDGEVQECRNCGGTNRKDAKTCKFCRRDLETGKLVLRQKPNGKTKKATNPMILAARDLYKDACVRPQPVAATASATQKKEWRAFTVLCVIVTGFVLGFAGIALFDRASDTQWFNKGSPLGDVKNVLCSMFRSGN